MNDFVRVMNAQGIFIFYHNLETIVYVCEGCMKVSKRPGFVDNKEDCEHGKPYRFNERMKPVYPNGKHEPGVLKI